MLQNVFGTVHSGVFQRSQFGQTSGDVDIHNAAVVRIRSFRPAAVFLLTSNKSATRTNSSFSFDKLEKSGLTPKL